MMENQKKTGPQMSAWHVDSGLFSGPGNFLRAWEAKWEAEKARKTKKEAERIYEAKKKELEAKDDRSVYFINDDLGIRKLVVDKEGCLQNFPGIETEDFWVKEVAHPASLNCTAPNISGSSFKQAGDEILLIWPFQQDRRYHEEAYGWYGGSQYGIRLYTKLDKEGNFMHPFRIYEMDTDA